MTRVQGQLDPTMIQAGAPLGVDAFGVVDQHLHGQGREVFQRLLLCLGVGRVRLRVADGQQADHLAPRRDQGRSGEEANIDLIGSAVQRGEAGINTDVRAEHGGARLDHQVGHAAGPGVFAGGNADASLVPKAVLIDEDHGRSRRAQDQGRHAGDAVEPAVRAAVERVQSPQRAQTCGLVRSRRP